MYSNAAPTFQAVSLLMQAPPCIEATASEGGVKTKTQLLAERNVLKQLLSTAVGAAADEDLAESATEFATGVCRHFAMLFAAGCSAPKIPAWHLPTGQGGAVGSSPAESPTAGTPGEPCTALKPYDYVTQSHWQQPTEQVRAGQLGSFLP